MRDGIIVSSRLHGCDTMLLSCEPQSAGKQEDGAQVFYLPEGDLSDVLIKAIYPVPPARLPPPSPQMTGNLPRCVIATDAENRIVRPQIWLAQPIWSASYHSLPDIRKCFAEPGVHVLIRSSDGLDTTGVLWLDTSGPDLTNVGQRTEEIESSGDTLVGRRTWFEFSARTDILAPRSRFDVSLGAQFSLTPAAEKVRHATRKLDVKLPDMLKLCRSPSDLLSLLEVSLSLRTDFGPMIHPLVEQIAMLRALGAPTTADGAGPT